MTDKSSSRSSQKQPKTGAEIRSAFLGFFAERGHQVIPSASLVPEDPTVLLTIAGMLPFKPVFLGQAKRPSARATSVQKCIRTNDIENVGRTARHHTYFEMLGNFSFGDYFKHQAILWAWELTTQVFSLDPKNLVVSIFRDDEEAEMIWRDVVGVNPKRIVRMDETDNFWSSGPTGPCGPCSEIYYDFKPELGDELIDLEDDERYIEFYNLVFMQYNKDAEGQLSPLATCNIDTGMGLERMAQILQRVPNNYETDLIYPLIEKATFLAGINYHDLDSKSQTSLKVIADHTRAVTQLIADGVIASNLGRGYVLRRLLRRVIRHGRLLGIVQPFLVEIGKAAIDLMKSAYPELEERRKIILNELQREEVRFLETLERGEKLLNEMISCHPNMITGDQAFELYDTYGFPIELTQEIADEQGLKVDLVGFEKAMQAQRQRAQSANVAIDLTLKEAVDEVVITLEATEFKGYETLQQKSFVKALIVNGKSSQVASVGDQVQIVLDRTAFYAEGGGQIGDSGKLTTFGSDKTDSACIAINNVIQNKSIFVHSGEIEKGQLVVGDQVYGQVDRSIRLRIQAHHTSTHLLQSALKKIVDMSIGQAGSLVDCDHLRFDFHSPKAVTDDELIRVEKLINEWIADSICLEVKEMEIKKAQAAGAIAMFGEKYSDLVRVVDVPGVSMELCGGTHVSNTSEIGIFKIVSESGIAAGIRRIEAVAGSAVIPFLNQRDEIVKNLADQLKTKPSDILGRVVSLQEELRVANKSLATISQELALAKAMSFTNNVDVIGNSKLIIQRLDGVDGGGLQIAAQGLLNQLGDNAGVVLGGIPDAADENKVIFVAAFGSRLLSIGLKAGQFVGEVAKLCGGGGGGRPNLAQAGGRDGKSLTIALKYAREKLESVLK